MKWYLVWGDTNEEASALLLPRAVTLALAVWVLVGCTEQSRWPARQGGEGCPVMRGAATHTVSSLEFDGVGGGDAGRREAIDLSAVVADRFCELSGDGTVRSKEQMDACIVQECRRGAEGDGRNRLASGKWTSEDVRLCKQRRRVGLVGAFGSLQEAFQEQSLRSEETERAQAYRLYVVSTSARPDLMVRVARTGERVRVVVKQRRRELRSGETSAPTRWEGDLQLVEWKTIMAMVDRSEFWKLPSWPYIGITAEETAFDGKVYFLEAAADGQSRVVVVRRQEGRLSELIEYLERLAACTM